MMSLSPGLAVKEHTIENVLCVTSFLSIHSEIQKK